MIHHKLIETNEFQTYNENSLITKYVLRFKKSSTKFFKSKCKYYSKLKKVPFEHMCNSGQVIILDENEICDYDYVVFEILYHNERKDVYDVELYLKNNDKRQIKYRQLDLRFYR